MKIKLTAILMVILMTFQIVAFADFQFGTTLDELTISGTASPYESVAFLLLDTDSMGLAYSPDPLSATISAYKSVVSSGSALTTTQVFDFQRVEAGSDGKWSCTIPMAGIETKNLTLLPSVGDAEYIQYASIGFRTGMLPNIVNAAKAADDGTLLSAQLTTYIGYISDRTSQYNALSNKLRVAKFTKDTIAALNPDDSASLAPLKVAVDEAILVSSVMEDKITDFDEAMSIATYKAEDKVKMSADGINKIVSILSDIEHESVSKYKEEAAYQFILQMFNYNVNQGSDYLYDFLDKNNTVLKLNLYGLNDLTPANRSQGAKQLADKKSISKAKAQENLDIIVTALFNAEHNVNLGGGGLSGGGSGGGGGGGSHTTVNENKPHNSSGATSITDEYLNAHKYIYSDLKQADWAVDAVLYLNKEGIINGYADNSFKPLNPITRAEFTKIIVSTFFIDTKPEKTGFFKDINGDEWFADYVNIAYNAGIVSGDQNGKFNPDETISRQDMAVIIYNAGLKFNLFSETETIEEFADDSEIADYAKKAVYTLKNSSIINGIGDGLFAPSASADRASAAKIIYELILSNEN